MSLVHSHYITHSLYSVPRQLSLSFPLHLTLWGRKSPVLSMNSCGVTRISCFLSHMLSLDQSKTSSGLSEFSFPLITPFLLFPLELELHEEKMNLLSLLCCVDERSSFLMLLSCDCPVHPHLAQLSPLQPGQFLLYSTS